MKTPQDTADLWAHLAAGASEDFLRQGLVVMFLDDFYRLLGVAMAHIKIKRVVGTASTESFDPFAVFRAATLLGCRHLVVVQNRYDFRPSTLDVLLTGFLARACEPLGMDLLDYVTLFTRGSEVLNWESFHQLEIERERKAKRAGENLFQNGANW
jgi:DNA repair protein RadC